MENDSKRSRGQLDLRRKQELGNGNHSRVFLAPLALPSCAGPTTYEVAVKVAGGSSSDREMLRDEAVMYEEFPAKLQESTLSKPPVVPNFYGYYMPALSLLSESSDESDDDNGDKEDVRTAQKHVCQLLGCTLSFILLLEPCGKPVECKTLSKSDK